MTDEIQPVALIIRDGWGFNPHAEQNDTNAIHLARTPCDDKLQSEWPSTLLQASGRDVGVPDGVIGNSEVGHQNIGAGRIVDQEIVRIDRAIKERTIEGNEVWQKITQHMNGSGARLHLMGLVSDAGVHSMLSHLYGLLELTASAGWGERVFIHAFTDGRDTSPTSGLRYVRELEENCAKLRSGKIATVCGRFWSMDRDNRWERVEKAYRCLVGEKAEHTANSATEAIQHYYDHPLDDSRKGDEFILPTWVTHSNGQPLATVASGDVVLFFNFRGDRPRELTRAFIEDEFDSFPRGPKPDLLFVTMTEYQKGLAVETLFLKPPKMKNTLGEWISRQGLRQFRCAETEKYPHVTFFFNDYREEPFEGEERGMAPSPKVPTYDLQPEMSAPEVIRRACEAIRSRSFALIVVNFANPDMVGHTGSLPATISAVETVDAGVAEILEACQGSGTHAIVTADHGNAEQMWDPAADGPHTAHTLNLVPLYVVGEPYRAAQLRESGRLADIAPTLLQMMGLPQPEEMTGRSLLV